MLGSLFLRECGARITSMNRPYWLADKRGLVPAYLLREQGARRLAMKRTATDVRPGKVKPVVAGLG